MSCRGTCHVLYGGAPVEGAGSRYGYGRGYKRCSVCGIWIMWDGVRCPCCTRALRTKPHRGAIRKARVAAAARVR